MSYRDPDLSKKWLSEAEWRAHNDRGLKFMLTDSRKIILRLIEEVRKLKADKEHLQAKLDKYSEQGYQQFAEDEEWISIQKAKREARNLASVGKDKIRRIANEVTVPRTFSKEEALSTLKKIKDIVEDK